MRLMLMVCGIAVWTLFMLVMLGWLLWITRRRDGVVPVCLKCGPVEMWDSNGNCMKCGLPVELE